MKRDIVFMLLGVVFTIAIGFCWTLSLRVKQLEANMGQIVNVLTQRQQARTQPVIADEKKK